MIRAEQGGVGDSGQRCWSRVVKENLEIRFSFWCWGQSSGLGESLSPGYSTLGLFFCSLSSAEARGGCVEVEAVLRPGVCCGEDEPQDQREREVAGRGSW